MYNHLCYNLPEKGRIQEFLIGGAQTLVQKGLLNFCMANYFSQRKPRVSRPVNAGRRWRGKRTGTDHRRVPKNNHIFEYPRLEFSLTAKCNACFIKKISQLKSDIYPADVRILVSNKRQV